ncbi:hypothetical protein ABMA57_00945 [Saccharospirillum sp. HFRX-1]|uniref:hypothetical protein n=1 Tax=unclassified Saccharospirillum TaxID=2633430 RepID=UPI0037143E8A
MTFYLMAIIMTGAAILLGMRFLFAGGSLLKEWGLEATTGSLILCRRIGALYFGVALLFFFGRHAAPSDFRSAVCLIAAGITAVLSGLGLFEFLSGRVRPGIFASVVAEAVVTVGFIWVWLGE